MSIRFLTFYGIAAAATAGLLIRDSGDPACVAIAVVLLFVGSPLALLAMVSPFLLWRWLTEVPPPPETWGPSEPWEDIPETIPVPLKWMEVGCRVRLPNGVVCRVTHRPEPYAMNILLEVEGGDERYRIESCSWVFREVNGMRSELMGWEAEELEPGD